MDVITLNSIFNYCSRPNLPEHTHLKLQANNDDPHVRSIKANCTVMFYSVFALCHVHQQFKYLAKFCGLHTLINM